MSLDVPEPNDLPEFSEEQMHILRENIRKFLKITAEIRADPSAGVPPEKKGRTMLDVITHLVVEECRPFFGDREQLRSVRKSLFGVVQWEFLEAAKEFPEIDVSNLQNAELMIVDFFIRLNLSGAMESEQSAQAPKELTEQERQQIMDTLLHRRQKTALAKPETPPAPVIDPAASAKSEEMPPLPPSSPQQSLGKLDSVLRWIFRRK